MALQQNKLFEPVKIGPITLRNRTIRAAAFEGMGNNNNITPELIEYHRNVAKGEIGMTTVAYASVSHDGYSFPHQLWIRDEIKPQLKAIADAVHHEGAAISIQLGHTGNMSNPKITGYRPISASAKFNLFGPTWPKKMNQNDIDRVIHDFANAVSIVKECGFNAVEIHAGHGYLISQFISPYTNKRTDEYGGSIENRSRFLKQVLQAVRKSAGNEMAVLAKMNLNDGFEGGISEEDAEYVAKLIESEGGDALILSGGFVSKMPMYVMRGQMPHQIMAHYISDPLVKFMVRWLGKYLIKSVPFKEGYFLDEGKRIVDSVSIPLVAVGGMDSIEIINRALKEGFSCVAMGRALIQDPGFIFKLKNQILDKTPCHHCNYCVAVMYSGKMRCYMNEENVPEELKKFIPKAS